MFPPLHTEESVRIFRTEITRVMCFNGLFSRSPPFLEEDEQTETGGRKRGGREEHGRGTREQRGRKRPSQKLQRVDGKQSKLR
jgi:hypothetical protein